MVNSCKRSYFIPSKTTSQINGFGDAFGEMDLNRLSAG